jgi:hypothetical protein
MNAGTAIAAAACGLTLLAAAGPAAARPADDPAAPAVEPDAELVENGSFEAPRSPRPGLVGNFPTIPGWTETTGHGLEIQNGLARRARGGGEQYVELDSRGPSSIYQDVATVPGRAYRLTFVYSPHPGTAAAENAFEVTFGDTTQAVAPAMRKGAHWRAITMDVRALEDTTRLVFADASGADRVRGLGVYIDLVSVKQAGA